MKLEEIIRACPLTTQDGYEPYITSNYGTRIYNGKEDFHHGIDMVIKYQNKMMTSPVQCCFERATIVFAGAYGNAGNSIILMDQSTSTRLQRIVACYCHLETIYDNVGDIVIQSEQIGYMGGTGVTHHQYNAHLHFSISVLEKDIPVDKAISGYGARDPFLFGLEKFFKPKVKNLVS